MTQTIQMSDTSGPATYQPDAEAARLAPACVCNVASRVLWLRQRLSEFDAETQRKLKPFTDKLPFEEELLSGNMARVDAAIKAIGADSEPWIPVEERLPEAFKTVEVRTASPARAWRGSGNHWVEPFWRECEVTHWRPLKEGA